MDYTNAASRRVAAYNNRGFEPEVEIISAQTAPYAVGGGCALYTKTVSYDMDADDGISLHPTPYYKKWTGKKVVEGGEDVKLSERIYASRTSTPSSSCSCCKGFLIFFAIIVVVGLALGLGLGLGLRH